MTSNQKPNEDSARRVSLWPRVYLIGLGYLGLHLATSTRYGSFRDALYYLACSEHLAFGYVDQPPLIAALAWVARHGLGASLPALLIGVAPALPLVLPILPIDTFLRYQSRLGIEVLKTERRLHRGRAAAVLCRRVQLA